MTRAIVLVDTSVWVEFLNRPSGAHHSTVASLLESDRVAISGVVAAELLRGCRSESEAVELEDALGGLIRIDLGFSDWVAIGRDLASLRRRGLTASLSDASVAHAAQRAGIGLYSLDADFARFWPHLLRFDPSHGEA